MWDFIDKVVYINLNHREDRRQIMSAFFEKGNIPLEKVQRFSAIQRSNGRLGCVESHMEVLKMAKREGWKNILILEDDLEWLNFEEGYKQVEELIKLPKWDVIMLTGWYWKYEFPRIFDANNTGAYLVNRSYYDTLLKNRETSVSNLKKGGSIFLLNQIQYNADVFWKHLQKKDMWYGIHPCICRQVDGFSDICKTNIKASSVVGIGTAGTRKLVYKR